MRALRLKTRRRQSLMPNPSPRAANLFSLLPKRRFCLSAQRMKPQRNQVGLFESGSRATAVVKC